MGSLTSRSAQKTPSAPSTDERSKLIEQLRRRVVVGNILGYTGMVGVLLIYFSQTPVHPILYAVAGVAVGSGTGLAYLSLWKIRKLRRIAREQMSN